MKRAPSEADFCGLKKGYVDIECWLGAWSQSEIEYNYF